jgi:hypothetical protein
MYNHGNKIFECIMEQVVSCHKCGAENKIDCPICVNCKEKLIDLCPSCSAQINLAFHYCTYCGVDLRRGIVPKQRSIEPSEQLKKLLGDVRRIGEIKNELPSSLQHWCDELGLHIWLRVLDRYSHGVDGIWVRAGGRFDAKLDASADPKGQWEIEKYRQGKWQDLVQPTLQAAVWLLQHQDLPAEKLETFQNALQLFKKTGKLELPK